MSKTHTSHATKLSLGLCLILACASSSGCADGAQTDDPPSAHDDPDNQTTGAEPDRTSDDSGGHIACDSALFEGQVTNARDVGGPSLPDGKRINCGRLLRGGHLDGLDESGCSQFENLAISTVIDLRDPNNTGGEAPPTCVTENADVISAPMPKLLPPTTQTYLALLEEAAAWTTLFETISDKDAFPVYIHCVIGRDRASVAVALVLLAAGVDRNEIVEEFMRSSDAGVEVSPEWIRAVLDEIDERGGIDAFVRSLGLDPEAIARSLAESLSR